MRDRINLDKKGYKYVDFYDYTLITIDDGINFIAIVDDEVEKLIDFLSQFKRKSDNQY